MLAQFPHLAHRNTCRRTRSVLTQSKTERATHRHVDFRDTLERQTRASHQGSLDCTGSARAIVARPLASIST